MEIIIATIVVAVIGLGIGIALVTTGKKFYVEVDEREEAVRACLPGNNCGACGYAGCDAVAAAIVKGEASVNTCPVNSNDSIQKIGRIMGVEVSEKVRQTAYVKCGGDCTHTQQKCNYVGIPDCRSAVLAGLSIWDCDYGCLGLGSCVKACNYQGIRILNGVAVVDPKKCQGCGACVIACPKHLIQLIPADQKYMVRCENPEKGAEVKKVCTAGCIGCKICVKQCEQEAITLDGFLAKIDPEKCSGCGKCAEKCPAGVIQKAVR